MVRLPSCQASCLLALMAACAGSAPPVSPASSAPEPLRFFVGAWEGKNQSASGQVTTLRWRVQPSLGGTWLAGEARVDENGVEARDFLGVQAGQIVRVYVDNQGSRATMVSTGWDGNAMIWEGEAIGADGSMSRVREKVVKVDERTLRARWEVWSNGAWALMSEETLTKQ
jgi:hypothetical protein